MVAKLELSMALFNYVINVGWVFFLFVFFKFYVRNVRHSDSF